MFFIFYIFIYLFIFIFFILYYFLFFFEFFILNLIAILYHLWDRISHIQQPLFSCSPLLQLFSVRFSRWGFHRSQCHPHWLLYHLVAWHLPNFLNFIAVLALVFLFNLLVPFFPTFFVSHRCQLVYFSFYIISDQFWISISLLRSNLIWLSFWNIDIRSLWSDGNFTCVSLLCKVFACGLPFILILYLSVA